MNHFPLNDARIAKTLPSTNLGSGVLLFLRGACVASLLWLAHPASAQNQSWIRRFGTPQLDSPGAAVSAGASGVYVLGQTQGSFGGPNAGGYDIWLGRFDSGGSQTWVRQIGSSAWEFGNGAAPDGSDGVFACGGTEGGLGGPNAGQSDAWLAHYDGSGNQTWIRQFGTSEWDSAGGVAMDGAGGVIVAGSTGGSLGGSNAGQNDAWLARYDGAGNRLWILQIGTSLDDYAGTVSLDGTGGAYWGNWTEGSLGGPNAGGGDAWLARHDGAGNQLWIRQLGTHSADVIRASAPDGAGGVYVSGYTAGSLGGPNAGDTDPWVARFDSAGGQTWIRQFGTNAIEDSYAVSSDGGGVYVGVEGLTATGGLLTPSLTRFDGTGTQLWTRSPALDGAQSFRGIALEGSGAAYVTGGYTEVWIARYEPICGPPSATFRNSGPNPPSLQVTPPMLGSSFTATVDLTTTGHDVAHLFAYDGAADIRLRGGQHFLCANLHGSGLLYSRTVAGPVATFQIPIRNDANLCGLHFSMQAVHYGGVVPFALSNAQDLVIGF